MSSQPDFLNQFQQKMDRLNAVRSGIQASVQSKEQFANYLKTRLQEINTGLKQLTGLINQLKNKADNLEAQISTNNASIGDKERQLEQLSKQLETLNIERNDLIAKMSQQDNATKSQMAQMAQLQNQINNYEAQVRDLKQLSETQSGELNALRQEMTRTGDERDKAHVQELARLTEQSRQQLEQQEAQLMQKIKECEAKMTGFDQQIRDKETGFVTRQREIEEKMMQAQNSGTALQSEIANLRNENEGLIQRLIAATNAINQSADDLQLLMADIPNAQSKQEIEALLNSISQQMGQSIENISRAAQGQPQGPMTQGPTPQGQVGPMTQMPPPSQMLSPDLVSPMQGQPGLPNNTPINVQGVTKELGDLKKLLQEKIRQVTRTNPNAVGKYVEALKKINSATSPQEVSNYLGNFDKSRITGALYVKGGRKTRKNRKQKGGFVYRTTVRRRRNSSKSKSRTASRKTSK